MNRAHSFFYDWTPRYFFHTCVPNPPLCDVFTDAQLLRSISGNSVHKMSMIISTSQERIFTHLGRYWPWKSACSRVRGTWFVIILQLFLQTFLTVNENHSNTDHSRLLWGWNDAVHSSTCDRVVRGSVVDAGICYCHMQNTMCGACGDTKMRWKQESRGGLTVCHRRRKDGKGYGVGCEKVTFRAIWA